MKSQKSLLFVILLFVSTSILYAQTPIASGTTTEAPHITSTTTGLYALPFQTKEEVEEFLKTAKIVKDKMLGNGITNPHKLTLDNGKVQSFAVWKTVDERRFGVTQLSAGAEVDFKDSWKFEVAAYELDKLLRLDMVPVTVERSYRGSKGSLQIWVPGCVTEDDRLKKRMIPPDPNMWKREISKVRLFDALVYNIDRNQGNLLIAPDWKLYMIDHSRTFKNLDALKAAATINYFSRSFMDAVRKLDKAALTAHCGKYLMSTEIETLLKRRDLLVALYDKLSKEQGDAVSYP